MSRACAAVYTLHAILTLTVAVDASGGEIVLGMSAAFSGRCTNVITNRIAAARGIPIAAMKISADAILDRRGAALEEEIATPVPEIDLRIECTTMATAEQVRIMPIKPRSHQPISKQLGV